VRYKLSINYQKRGSTGPAEATKRVVVEGVIPIPSPGDTITYGKRPQTATHRVVSREFIYADLPDECAVVLLVTDP
jgi:hypothetical protein